MKLLHKWLPILAGTGSAIQSSFYSAGANKEVNARDNKKGARSNILAVPVLAPTTLLALEFLPDHLR